MWKVIKYFFSFAFLSDFKAGMKAAEIDHKEVYCGRLKKNFYENMVRVNEEDDEFGLVD